MQVLVVEDEVLIRLLVCDLLEDAGFLCTSAATAEEALELLDSGECRPDLMCTDFNLGPGLDGKQLARAVQQRLPGLPTIYATGNPDCFEDHPLRPWERLVPKPFSASDLVATVRELRPGGARPPQAAPQAARCRGTLVLAGPA
jgi:two-component system, OmpR family, response regulator